MGIFNMFKHNGQQPAAPASGTAPQQSVQPSSEGLLDLQKGDILDLSKYSDTLERVHAAAGWDIAAKGRDYDLDLCAYLMKADGKVKKVVYYGDKKSHGIFLDQDNLTGEGDGDDENIHVRLSQLPEDVTRVVFAVVIYQAAARHQVFDKVKNAYVRLCDEDNGDREICRYRLSEDGGDNTAVEAAELKRTSNGTWEFHAIGEYSHNSIGSLEKHLNS